jgi:hypothetical protein
MRRSFAETDQLRLSWLPRIVDERFAHHSRGKYVARDRLGLGSSDAVSDDNLRSGRREQFGRHLAQSARAANHQSHAVRELVRLDHVSQLAR